MKQKLALAVFSLLAGVLLNQDDQSKNPIALAEIQERGVTGLLGLKLGTVTRVSATVISGAELRTKAADGKYLLRVSHVGGSELKESIIVNFHVASFANVKLASNHFDLYELKNGKRARSLQSSQIKKLEENYVGNRVELVVFEEGQFSGLPKGLPAEDQWSDSVFHFSTFLTVLKHADSK